MSTEITQQHLASEKPEIVEEKNTPLSEVESQVSADHKKDKNEVVAEDEEEYDDTVVAPVEKSEVVKNEPKKQDPPVVQVSSRSPLVKVSTDVSTSEDAKKKNFEEVKKPKIAKVKDAPSPSTGGGGGGVSVASKPKIVVKQEIPKPTVVVPQKSVTSKTEIKKPAPVVVQQQKNKPVASVSQQVTKPLQKPVPQKKEVTIEDFQDLEAIEEEDESKLAMDPVKHRAELKEMFANGVEELGDSEEGEEDEEDEEEMNPLDPRLDQDLEGFIVDDDDVEMMSESEEHEREMQSKKRQQSQDKKKNSSKKHKKNEDELEIEENDSPKETKRLVRGSAKKAMVRIEKEVKKIKTSEALLAEPKKKMETTPAKNISSRQQIQEKKKSSKLSHSDSKMSQSDQEQEQLEEQEQVEEQEEKENSQQENEEELEEQPAEEDQQEETVHSKVKESKKEYSEEEEEDTNDAQQEEDQQQQKQKPAKKSSKPLPQKGPPKVNFDQEEPTGSVKISSPATKLAPSANKNKKVVPSAATGNTASRTRKPAAAPAPKSSPATKRKREAVVASINEENSEEQLEDFETQPPQKKANKGAQYVAPKSFKDGAHKLFKKSFEEKAKKVLKGSIPRPQNPLHDKKLTPEEIDEKVRTYCKLSYLLFGPEVAKVITKDDPNDDESEQLHYSLKKTDDPKKNEANVKAFLRQPKVVDFMAWFYTGGAPICKKVYPHDSDPNSIPGPVADNETVEF